jgi:hypothetical protein
MPKVTKHIATASLFLLAACTTAEKKEAEPAPIVPVAPQIDLHAIQHELGMDAAFEWVGYREKKFDACRLAAEIPGVPDCKRAYFVQIGFQLSCRPPGEREDGFLNPIESTPIGDRELTWKLEGYSGRLQTDPVGFGLIQMLASRSMKSVGLRISTGEDYLMIRAGQATQIVTPASWCPQQGP